MAVLGVGLVFAAASPAPAHALIDRYSDLPEAKKQVWRGFQQYLAGQGQPNALSPVQQEQFQRLVEDYNRTQRGTGPFAGSRAQRLWTKVRGFGTRVNGLLGRLPLGSTIGLGTVSFGVGYYIGTQANRMLLGFGTPNWDAPEAVTSVSLVPTEAGSYPGGGDAGHENAPSDGYAVRSHYAVGGARYHYSATGTDVCSNALIFPTIGQADPTTWRGSGPSSEGSIMKAFSSATTTFCPPGSPQNEYETLEDPMVWLFVPFETMPQTRPTQPYNPNDPEQQPDQLIPLELPTQTELDQLPNDIDTEMEHPRSAEVEQWALHNLDTDPDTGEDLHQDPFEEYVVVPEIEPGETYPQYRDRLVELGLEGQREDLTEEFADPDFGPDVAIRTDPQTGSEVPSESTVTVFTNPPSMPPVEEGGGTCVDHEVRSIDFGPLDQNPGEVFPFGFVVWISDTIGSWTGEGEPPVLRTDAGGLLPDEVVIDLAIAQPFLDVVHPVIVIAAFVTLIVVFASAFLGLGSATQKDD